MKSSSIGTLHRLFFDAGSTDPRDPWVHRAEFLAVKKIEIYSLNTRNFWTKVFE